MANTLSFSAYPETVNDVMDMVDDLIRKGPPVSSILPQALPEQSKDPMLDVVDVAEGRKQLAWIRSNKIIDKDRNIITSDDGIDPEMLFEYVRMLGTDKPCGYIDLDRGDSTTEFKWHRFIMYNRGINKQHNSEIFASTLGFLIIKNRQNAEDDNKFMEWLQDENEVALYHTRVKILTGYSLEDVAVYVELNGWKWPVV
jgi:hypothetical protein